MPSFIQYSLTTSGVGTGALASGVLPLTSGAGFIAPGPTVDRAPFVNGSISTDVNGTLYIDQSFDQKTWPVTSTVTVVSGVGQGFQIAALAPNVRFRYTNGSFTQTSFQLNARTISEGT